MATKAARAREVSQAETPAPFGAPCPPQADPDIAALPPAETDPAERRGPMRPGALSPTRARLSGWMLTAIFQLADVAALGLIALVAAPLAAGDLAPAALSPFIAGALVVL